MRKDFLFECEKNIAKADVCMAQGQEEQNFQLMKKVSCDIAAEITSSVTPVSDETASYVVAALRVLADALERELTPLDKELSNAVQELMAKHLVFQKYTERV